MAGCSLAREHWSRDLSYPSFFNFVDAGRVSFAAGIQGVGQAGCLGGWLPGESDCTCDAPYPGRAAARLDGAQPGSTGSSWDS